MAFAIWTSHPWRRSESVVYKVRMFAIIFGGSCHDGTLLSQAFDNATVTDQTKALGVPVALSISRTNFMIRSQLRFFILLHITSL